MFEVMVKEIAKKELGKMSVEVLEKRKSLNPCFKTGLRPNEGVFKSMRFDDTDKPHIAVSIVVEESDVNGIKATAIARSVMDEYYKLLDK